jgi:hypothetical protein
MTLTCDFTGDQLWDVVPGLAALSKDIEGELVPLAAEKEECLTFAEPTVTLSTRHAIKANLTAHHCDSKLSRLLDGTLLVERLTTVFEDADALGRGLHAGDFRLAGSSFAVVGTMQGVTNAGIMRDPLARAVEECASPGVMLGRLCGRVVRGRRGAAPQQLRGALVTGIYRLEFDHSDIGGSGLLRGTLEGGLLQECGKRTACIDFGRLADGSNPRVEQGHRIEVFDASGTAQPTTEIRTWGTISGLHLWYRTEVVLSAPASKVVLTIGRFATEGKVTAYSSSGAALVTVPIAGPQNTPLQVVVPGPGIVRLEIECPSDEHLLQQMCVEP